MTDDSFAPRQYLGVMVSSTFDDLERQLPAYDAAGEPPLPFEDEIRAAIVELRADRERAAQREAAEREPDQGYVENNDD